MEQFAKRASVVHVDVDPKELGKIKAVDMSLTADVGDVLKGLNALVAEVGAKKGANGHTKQPHVL